MLRRLSYTQKTDDREALDVVKGVAKRVIVVKSPDPKVFEDIHRPRGLHENRRSHAFAAFKRGKAGGGSLYRIAERRQDIDSSCCRAVNASRQRSRCGNNVFNFIM